MSKNWSWLGVMFGIALMIGCNGNATDGLDMAELPPDLSPGPYPTGPYGGDVGKVIDNLTFQGYFSPTKTSGLASAEPLGEVTLDKLRLAPNAKFLMIHLAAYWCGPCLSAAKALAAKTSTFAPKGGLLMGILAEGTTPADVATKNQLDLFISKAGAQFTYVLDGVAPQTDAETYFSNERDTFIMIDLKTMKIVKVVDNFSGGGGFAEAIPAFEALLQ